MRSAAILPLAPLAALALASCGQEAGGPGGVRAGSLAAPRSAPVDDPPAAVARSARSARSGSSGLLRGTVTRLNGEADDLARYRGKVVLVVNTASRCINTPQYGELEALYRARRGSGALPLYRRLAAASEPPSWNFTKYLLDRRGRLVARFDPYLPADAPQVRRAIDRLL